MSTADLIANAGEAIDALADDHAQRLVRIEARRQWAAVRENKVKIIFDRIRNALAEAEKALEEQFNELQQLDRAELAETSGDETAALSPPDVKNDFAPSIEEILATPLLPKFPEAMERKPRPRQ